ncbi:MAG TPA: hypothetical protein VGP93_12025, partial [Polyangiaceae bacterium]|nr:hypothetical protein [Polyangiaceae bacterium]
PFLLALGLPLGFSGLRLMEWAAILACVSVLCTLCLCRRMFAELPRAASYLAPFSLLCVGALDWSLFSGMEVALFLAIWARTYCAWDELFVEKTSAPRLELSRSSWALGVWGAVLVATRPEAAALVGLFAGSAAIKLWPRGRRGALEILVRAALPSALVLALHALANRLLTGDSTAAGALVKLELYHPYLTGQEVRSAWWFHLKYQVLRVTQYHLADPGIFGWLLWLLAAAAWLPRATRRPAAMLWASAALWLMVVALNGQVRWQNERYSMPAVAWLLLAAALGLGGLIAGAFERERRVLRRAGALAGVAAAALLLFYQAPRFREQLWFFGRASRNILEQHVRAALIIRHEVEPTPNRVMVGDAGAIPYVSDVPALDIIGLGGFRGLPFARATRANVAAGLELIERLPAEDRPELMALYPSWWGELPLFFGTAIAQVPVRGNVICGGLSKVLYRSDFSAMEGSAWPTTLRSGEIISDDIDIADLVSEREHAYRLSPGVIGYVTMKILSNPRVPAKDLWDAGRVIAPGAREMFRLRGIDGRRPFRLIVRTAATQTLHVPLTIAGRRLGAFHGEPSDDWQELSVDIPALGNAALEVVLEPSTSERTLYHLWAVQSP